MTVVTVAASDQHFEGILALQRLFLRRTASTEQQAEEGFVYVEHTLPLLRRMSERSPQAIALADDRVVGYCLSLPPELRADVPSLAPLFERLTGSTYRGRPLSTQRIVVGGQVCVAREHRGQGLLVRLYHQVREALPFPCDVCVTEVATRNDISLRAHHRMGFETVDTYSDDGEEWAVVAWDLSRPAASALG